jgi:hypothetical protein
MPATTSTENRGDRSISGLLVAVKFPLFLKPASFPSLISFELLLPADRPVDLAERHRKGKRENEQHGVDRERRFNDHPEQAH